VLFTRSGTVGRCAIASDDHDGHVITFHLLRVRPEQRVCRSRYLWMALTGAPSIRRQANEAQIGSTRGGFNTRLLASLDVPLPPPDEQDEIVRRADTLLRLADVVERRVRAVRLRGDTLSQAILARAYTGDLLPTEAELARRDGRDYEPVSTLLDRVRSARPSALSIEKPVATRRRLRKSSTRRPRISA
jgi:type I restriction enzyme S subunit